MATVIQMVRHLEEPPKEVQVTGVRLRTFAGDDDIRGWLELQHKVCAEESMRIRPWDASDFEAEFTAKPWWQPDRLWLAETDKDPNTVLVGAVAMALRGSGSEAKAVIHWLMVDPAHRREGTARWLLHTLETCAWNAGYRSVWLETLSTWAPALYLYQACGYREVPG